MNAMLIYEDCDAAKRACALLKRASDRAEGAIKWTIHPWRAQLLDDPSLAEAALHDATPANLLMFATSSASILRSGMLKWVEKWSSQREAPGAAIALFDAKGEHEFAEPPPQLSTLAEANGLSLICGSVFPDDNCTSEMWQDLHCREVAHSTILDGILAGSVVRGRSTCGYND